MTFRYTIKYSNIVNGEYRAKYNLGHYDHVTPTL